MENQPSSDDEQQPSEAQDESVEEFKEDVENDPATANGPDEETEKYRGG